MIPKPTCPSLDRWRQRNARARNARPQVIGRLWGLVVALCIDLLAAVVTAVGVSPTFSLETNHVYEDLHTATAHTRSLKKFGLSSSTCAQPVCSATAAGSCGVTSRRWPQRVAVRSPTAT